MTNGRWETVSLEQIFPHPDNIREISDVDEIALERLGQEIKTIGQQVPLIVYPHPSRAGDFMIVDGHRRRLGMIRAGVRDADCIIIETPENAERDIETMLTTGRNQKPITLLEEAKGFQKLLDLGVTEFQLGRKFKQQTTDVKAKAKLTKASDAVQSLYAAGDMDLLEAKELQDLEETAPELYKEVVDRLETDTHTQRLIKQGHNSVQRLIETAKLDKQRAEQTAFLVQLGAKELPSQWWSKYTNYTGAELTDAEHAAKGHHFMLYTDGPHWYVATNGGTAKKELTDEEKAAAKEEEQRLRTLNAGIAVDYNLRRKFLIQQIQEKQCVSEAADAKLLFQFLKPTIAGLPGDVLAELTGISEPPETPYAAHAAWREKVLARIEKYSWRQLARLVTWKQYWEEDRRVRSLRGFGETEQDRRWRINGINAWYKVLEEGFGYTMTDTEHEALQLMTPPENPPVSQSHDEADDDEDFGDG